MTKSGEVLKANKKYYNLQGMEILRPVNKGIYIHNGKKIIVK